VCGWFYPTGFTLRKAIWYANPFQTVAAGRIRGGPQGTRVWLCLGMEETSAIFPALWLVVWIVLTLIIAAQWRSAPESFTSHPAWVSSVLFLFLAWGYGFLVFARWLARDEGGFLLQFLREALEAEEVSRR
jgi:hypothetical protein